MKKNSVKSFGNDVIGAGKKKSALSGNSVKGKKLFTKTLSMAAIAAMMFGGLGAQAEDMSPQTIENSQKYVINNVTTSADLQTGGSLANNSVFSGGKCKNDHSRHTDGLCR